MIVYNRVQAFDVSYSKLYRQKHAQMTTLTHHNERELYEWSHTYHASAYDNQ